MKMPIIALGRQFGSGGREIGKRLAERLNVRCYDRELITLAAQEAVRRYAQKLGMAFQVRDDMLDVEGNEATLGKPVGSDQANEKTTFVSLLGMDDCRALVKKLTAEAVEALAPFGAERAGFLCWLAEALAGRES